MEAMNQPKATRTVTVANRAGLHARPALLVANCVRKFQAKVELVTESPAGRRHRHAPDALARRRARAERSSWKPPARRRKSSWTRWSSCSPPSFTKTTSTLSPGPSAEGSAQIAVQRSMRNSKVSPFRPAWPSARRWSWTTRDSASLGASSRAIRSSTSWSGSTGRSRPPARRSPATATPSPSELGEKYAAIFEAHLQMLQDSKLRERAGGDDQPAALLAGVRRQPHAAPLRPGLPEGAEPQPGRHLRHREAALAPAPRPAPRRNLAADLAGPGPGPRPDPQRDGQPRPPLRARLRDRGGRARAATRRSWPARWKSRRWSAPGRS